MTNIFKRLFVGCFLIQATVSLMGSSCEKREQVKQTDAGHSQNLTDEEALLMMRSLQPLIIVQP